METRKRCLSGLCFLLILVVFSVPAYGEKKEAQEIAPPDVFARVARVRDEIELVRREMGKPKLERPNMHVRHASVRDVFFESLLLYRKVSELCLELTGRHSVLPAFPETDVHFSEVLIVFHSAWSSLQTIKKKLGITERIVEPKREPERTTSDVFRSIMQANYQLDLMVDRQFSPSDVYQKISLAIGYSALLLRWFPGVQQDIPPPPL
ncbi:MAG: hypothetical protein ACE5GQ_01200 [Nitrospinales bacterium]